MGVLKLLLVLVDAVAVVVEVAVIHTIFMIIITISTVQATNNYTELVTRIVFAVILTDMIIAVAAVVGVVVVGSNVA